MQKIDGSGANVAQVIQQLESMLQQIEQKIEGAENGGGVQGGTTPGTLPSSPDSINFDPRPAPGSSPLMNKTASPSPSTTSTGSALSTTASHQTSQGSIGSGPNVIHIKNTQDHDITIGKFKNGESTTDPSAKITIKPGQTASVHYQNGEAGVVSQANANGKFLPTASRLEYEADANGKMKFPDVSYIDGRNASIQISDGKGLNKGDDTSIASQAPSNLVSRDSAGNATIAGWYDGSTATMKEAGDFLENKLGMNGAYIHPDDDRNGAGNNPMSGTTSNELYASFGNA